MLTWLIGFLGALETLLPPPDGSHYALMRLQYGSEEDGWEDRIGLRMRCADEMRTFFLNDGDFSKAPDVLAAEVVKLVQWEG